MGYFPSLPPQPPGSALLKMLVAGGGGQGGFKGCERGSVRCEMGCSVFSAGFGFCWRGSFGPGPFPCCWLGRKGWERRLRRFVTRLMKLRPCFLSELLRKDGNSCSRKAVLMHGVSQLCSLCPLQPADLQVILCLVFAGGSRAPKKQSFPHLFSMIKALSVFGCSCRRSRGMLGCMQEGRVVTSGSKLPEDLGCAVIFALFLA